MACFDRREYFKWVEDNVKEKDLLIFYNSHRNGMSIFLRELCNRYENALYFSYSQSSELKETFKKSFDKVLDLIKRTETKNFEIVRNIFDSLKKSGFIGGIVGGIAKYFIDTAHNKSNENIKDRFDENIALTLAEILNKNSIVIIDNADKMTGNDINFIRTLNEASKGITFIIALKESFRDDSIVQLTNLIKKYTKKEFRYPRDEDITEILNGLYIDFSPNTIFSEYNNMKDLLSVLDRLLTSLSNDAKRIFSFIQFINCPIEKDLLENIFEMYHTKNPLFTDSFQSAISELTRNDLLSISGSQILKTNRQYDENKLISSTINKILLINYLSTTKDYELENIEFLEFLFEKVEGDLFSHLQNVTEIVSNLRFAILKKTDNYAIICKYLKSTIYVGDFVDYKEMVIKLYNYGLFDKFELINLSSNSIKRHEPKIKIIKILFDERMQKEIDLEFIIEEIIDTKDSHIDYATLLLIHLFTIFLNRKGSRQYINDILRNSESDLYYKKYEISKYFYWLGNIVAYYLNDYEKSIELYEYSLKKVAKKNFFYYRLLNNYFAFLVKEYNKDFSEDANAKIDEFFQKYLQDKSIFSDEDYNFFVHNYCILKTLRMEHIEEFEFRSYISRSSTQTQMIYNEINCLINKAITKKITGTSEFLYLEDIVKNSSIETTKLFYYYNLYIFSTIANDEETKLRAKENILTSRNYEFSIIKNKFDELLKTDENIVINNLVKYFSMGYLFYRQPDFRLFITALDS